MELKFPYFVNACYRSITVGSRGAEGAAAPPSMKLKKKWGAGSAVLKNKYIIIL